MQCQFLETGFFIYDMLYARSTRTLDRPVYKTAMHEGASQCHFILEFEELSFLLYHIELINYKLLKRKPKEYISIEYE